MKIECVDKEDVINIIKETIEETDNLILKWYSNSIIRKVNNLPIFLSNNNLVSSTLKDTEISNNTSLPSYYGDKIDFITAMEEGLVPREKLVHFCELNSIKYILRYKQKGGVDDLHKAKTYIEKLIQYENHEK